MTTEAPPRIWFSRILTLTKIVRYGITGVPVEYVDACRLQRPYVGDFVPKTLEPRQRAVRIPKTEEDAFRIGGGVTIISPKLRDVLVQFDLGATHLAKVSWINWDDTPSPRPPHYIFHVAETKPTFIPEQSKNIKQYVFRGEPGPRPNTPWDPDLLSDDLAVMASAADGVDMWRDPNLNDRVFFTDRLRQAIEVADLNAKLFTLQEARVVA